jgi:hypothetical protein
MGDSMPLYGNGFKFSLVIVQKEGGGSKNCSGKGFWVLSACKKYPFYWVYLWCFLFAKNDGDSE